MCPECVAPTNAPEIQNLCKTRINLNKIVQKTILWSLGYFPCSERQLYSFEFWGHFFWHTRYNQKCIFVKENKIGLMSQFVRVFSRDKNFFSFSRKLFQQNLYQKPSFVKVVVKNFAFFSTRESFCPRKFLPLKYPDYA